MTPGHGLRASPQPLVAVYDAALIDLDGVVYVGPEPVTGAVDAISAARDAGLRIGFLTNNASRTPETVAGHLRALGVAADPLDVITAAQAVAALLRERLRPAARVLVTGAPALRDAVATAGFVPVSSADDRPAAVVSGYDVSFDYARLAEATLAVSAGALWVAANLDATLPSPRGLLPGNGALVAAIAAATGRRPLSVGKPERALYDEAVQRTGARRPLMVGDRLDTDIAGAAAAGMDSLAVLTGVARPIDVLLAEPPARPTYLARDLSGLLAAHPAPDLQGELASCGGWCATLDGPVLTVRLRTSTTPPDGRDALDGLRAACAVAWAAADAGRLPTGLQAVGLPLT